MKVDKNMVEFAISNLQMDCHEMDNMCDCRGKNCESCYLFLSMYAINKLNVFHCGDCKFYDAEQYVCVNRNRKRLNWNYRDRSRPSCKLFEEKD